MYIRISNLLPFLLITIVCSVENEYCSIENTDCKQNTRYLFYDVNPPEGFNLRRDVFMRYAILAHKLSKSKNELLNKFQLVLPPWSLLFHWSRSDEPEHIPWASYFDLESMRKFAPIIEMHQFFDEYGNMYGKTYIDEVYVLQHYKDMFTSGKFEDKMSIEPCNNEINTNFFYYTNLTSRNVRCLSFHGFTSQLSEILKNTTARTVMFDHGEVALHDRFGDTTYWKCRRSMRFNENLRMIANKFREAMLNSSDPFDNTQLPQDWRLEKPRRNAKGGPYLAVHLRRRDFVWSRAKHVPSLKNAAKQIRKKLEDLSLNTVFIATDAPIKEYEELKEMLTKDSITVHKFTPNREITKEDKDGGIAIIEQIICSYARYFIGTYESTYSFRIQEEREILGFPVDATFNRFCGDDEKKCGKTSQWTIEY